MKNLHLKIVSDSMMPLIHVGDEIFIDKIADPFRDLKRFDILLFRVGEKYFCHFLWKIENQHFITKGLKDLRHEDLPFSEKMIIGRVNNFRLGLFQRLRIYFYFLRNKA